MGLDMYMFKVEKLTEEEVALLKGTHLNNIVGTGLYRYSDKEVFDDNPYAYADLLPYVTQISVRNTVFDQQRCFAEHNISEDVTISGLFQGRNEIKYYFSDGTKLELSGEEYDSYLRDISMDTYIWKSTEVAYWRAFDELHDAINKLNILRNCDQMAAEGKTVTDSDILNFTIQNCGYYLISNEDKDLLKDFLEQNDPDEFYSFLDDKKSAIVYYAWW